MFLRTLLILWASSSLGVAQNTTLEVELEQGRISASREPSSWGRFFYSFKGIPYAKPPVGDLRFADPEPAEAWSGVRNGSVSPPVCPQIDPLPGENGETIVKGQEDCLFLNVYTPRAFPSDLPVMVWFHGGAFLVGGTQEYPPLPLLKKDVVLVTVQYRLGTLGFLSTEDSVMAGNLGLKDQTLALRWVQSNIRDLGGDPSKVTIFGQGAGAASAHFQVLSPHATGLFRRAILQSGNSLSPWALRSDHKQVATDIGQVFNCTSVNTSSASLNSTALMNCLQEIPFERLVVIPSAFVKWLNTPQVMTPRIDGSFLPAHPATLLKDGLYNEVDLISGVTQDEGALPALATLANPPVKAYLINNFADVAPAVLGLEAESNPLYVARRAFNIYLPEVDINEETVGNFARLLGDEAFDAPNAEVLRLHCRRGRAVGNIYAYKLQHRGVRGLADAFNTSFGKIWVSNGDDLQYLFNENAQESGDDQRLSEALVQLWTNFASTGMGRGVGTPSLWNQSQQDNIEDWGKINISWGSPFVVDYPPNWGKQKGYPTPDRSLGFRWAKAYPSCLRYLHLGPKPGMQMDDRIQAYQFWSSLPTQRNRILYPQSFTSTSWGPTRDQKPPGSYCGNFPFSVFDMLFQTPIIRKEYFGKRV